MRFAQVTFLCAAIAVVPMVARATTIDFSGLPNGTAVSTQYPGVTFSLQGGPDSSGSPTTWNYQGEALGNSNSSGYPTADILDIAFAVPASGVSFTFNNYGFGVGSGAPTTYTAYAADGTVLDSGNLIDDYTNFTLVTVNGSNVADLKIDNNEGNNSWYFAIQALNFTEVPEPASMAVLGAGLVGLGVMRRRS